ncbi:MAG: GspH/FimT family protein, partial [Paraglaciecola sp.]|nr:GspH/FimT family protein [Paraglaciecola sp.]
DWANGAHIYTDTGTNGNAYDSSTDVLIKDIDIAASGIAISEEDNNDNVISFTSSGLLNEGVGATRTFKFCQNTDETQGTSLIINSVGRASINSISDCP